MRTKNYQIKWNYDLGLTRNNKPTIITYCVIYDLNGEAINNSGAKCSDGDNFNKDTGRKLSLLRAMQNAGIPKKERKSIWEIYRTMTKKPRWGK